MQRAHFGITRLAALLCGLALCLGSGPARAGDCDLEYDDAEFFIEINATDGDAGVQLMLDGEGWNEMEMTDPFDNLVLEILAPDGAHGSVGVQGLTEFFFESAEPSFDVQTLQELLDLFPEGEYAFRGLTTDGETICAEAEFTHDIPAIPEPEVCVEDGDEPTICWEEVEDPFDDPNGAEVGDEFEIDAYRLIVEAFDEEGEGLETLDVELPSDALCMSLPEEFVALSPVGVFKYEVIATEESGNQTIFEGTFELGDADDCEDEDDESEDSESEDSESDSDDSSDSSDSDGSGSGDADDSDVDDEEDEDNDEEDDERDDGPTARWGWLWNWRR